MHSSINVRVLCALCQRGPDLNEQRTANKNPERRMEKLSVTFPRSQMNQISEMVFRTKRERRSWFRALNASRLTPARRRTRRSSADRRPAQIKGDACAGRQQQTHNSPGARSAAQAHRHAPRPLKWTVRRRKRRTHSQFLTDEDACRPRPVPVNVPTHSDTSDAQS